MQRIIERLDNVYDEIQLGKKSKLDGKVGGIVITGDSDGGEQVTGVIANFFNGIGIILPPYATLVVLVDEHAKNTKTTRSALMKKYKKEEDKTAKIMTNQLVKYVKAK